jgi:hypothetical protein
MSEMYKEKISNLHGGRWSRGRSPELRNFGVESRILGSRVISSNGSSPEGAVKKIARYKGSKEAGGYLNKYD